MSCQKQEKVIVIILIVKYYCRAKNITRNKESHLMMLKNKEMHFIMMKESVH